MRANPNYEVVKEPRGFIKCLEIILAIFAFSCATGFRGDFKFRQDYNGTANHNVEGKFKYPFDSSVMLTVATFNKTKSYVDVAVEIDQRSSTEFFVVIGVFCFLYSLGVLVYYIFFQEDTKSAPTTMLNSQVVDFVIGGFWAFFWFASACAQAAATNHIKDSTDVKKIISSMEYCSSKNLITCEVLKSANYATLTISVLLGFLNVFVWAGNMWFLWKETPWHKGNRQPAATVHQPPAAPQHQPTPPAAAI